MCDGGALNATGAPPKATWGNGADAIRIGAHSAHVTGTPLAAPIACTECHVKPTDALSSGHVTGPTATITWGPLARSSGAAPSWTRTTATCATTYCHGGYSGTFTYFFFDAYSTVAYAGGKGSPKWTDGPMTCTSCHANPPRNGNWHDPTHGGGSSCNLCHPDVDAAGTAITNPALHVNGAVDVVATFKTSCFGCH